MVDETISQDLINEFVGVAHGDFSAMQAFLKDHPELLNARAVWNESAIEAATQMGQVEMVHFLLSAGAPLDIFTAAMLGWEDRVTAFLADNPGLAKQPGVHGLPSLYFAAIRGQQSTAELLLAHGAKVNGGAGGNTPLHGAVAFEQVDMIRWLLEHGAQTSLVDYNDKTPLDLAQANGKVEILALLTQTNPNKSNT